MAQQEKIRLDELLVQRGLVDTRARAKARVLAGDVVVGDHREDKPGHKVAPDVEIRFKKDSLPYVSRGGFKLAKALELWPCEIEGKVCIDVGASTGGFTDVLLQHGAGKVFAVDVGYGQLHMKIRNHENVEVHERTHILKAPEGAFLPKPEIAVADLSFIGLRKVLPGLMKHLAPTVTMYLLIKPQFELERHEVPRGGIVRDKVLQDRALSDVVAAAEKQGFKLIGSAESPIRGADGNLEWVTCFKREE